VKMAIPPVDLSAGCHVGGSCHVYRDAQHRQMMLAGKISVRPAGFLRIPNTPAPWSGFLTDNTPFDKGHIMALELGGPDVTENILPQYEQWQENGAWKTMENAVKAVANGLPGGQSLVLVVGVDYGRPGLPTYVQSLALFGAGQRLTAWEDVRIPTNFRIWTLNSVTTPVGAWLAPLLAANTPPTELQIRGQLPGSADYDLTMDAMPATDRVQQRKHMIGEAARTAYRNYETQHQADTQSFFNQPLAGTKKRTRGSLSHAVAAGAIPAPAPKLNRRDWLDANWATVTPTIMTNDMTVPEQVFHKYDVVSSVAGMFGV